MHDPGMSVLNSMDAHGVARKAVALPRQESLCDLQETNIRGIGAVRANLDPLGTARPGIFMLLIGAAASVPGTAPVFGIGLPDRTRVLSQDERSLGCRLGSGAAAFRGMIYTASRRAWCRASAGWKGGSVRGSNTCYVGRCCAAGSRVPQQWSPRSYAIPFGNTAPALAAILLALGLATGDGLIALAGLFLSVIALAVGAGLIFLGYEAFSILALFN